MWIFIQAQIPSENTLYFYPNNSSLSQDNAGYIALESIESPWQWQGFLQGHWKQCLEELHHLTQGRGHCKDVPFPAWAAGNQN